MSGGVDSSVSAKLLQNQGFKVYGITLYLSENDGADAAVCGALAEAECAKRVCDRLNIEHTVLDLRNEFKTYVKDYFAKSYLNGQTPNPCIACNQFIKFGEMLIKCAQLGAEKIATGHYARIQKQNDRHLLLKAADQSKDQSYVLYTLTQDQLSKTLFPLGQYTKQQIREMADEYGFENAHKPDSQDICFVPDGDYAAFIERSVGQTYPDGEYVDKQGKVIGHHRGAIRYTVGQRKGLGMGFGRPMYVLDKDMAQNKVILGDEEDLFSKRVLVRDVNLIALDKLSADIKCYGKLRYSQKEAACRITPLDQNTVLAEFDEPQRAVTAGQAAVFYDGDVVIGGGTITK